MTYCAVDTEGVDIDLYKQYYDSGWTVSGDIAIHSSCNPGNIGRTNIPIQIGKQYKIVYDVISISNGSVNPFIGIVNGDSTAETGEQTVTITTTVGINLGFFSDADCEIQLLSVTELSSGNGTTIAYNEKTKSFSSFYSYIPEKMVTILSDFLSFKGGKMYLHNVADSDYNTFYDVQTSSEIVAVVNNAPKVIKTFLGIFLDSNSEWELKETDQGDGIVTSNGQVSEIISQDYRIEDLGSGVFITKKEGVYYADFYRDINSPGGLIEGDVLNGNWLKIKLTNDDNNFVYLWSVFINAVV